MRENNSLLGLKHANRVKQHRKNSGKNKIGERSRDSYECRPPALVFEVIRIIRNRLCGADGKPPRKIGRDRKNYEPKKVKVLQGVEP